MNDESRPKARATIRSINIIQHSHFKGGSEEGCIRTLLLPRHTCCAVQLFELIFLCCFCTIIFGANIYTILPCARTSFFLRLAAASAASCCWSVVKSASHSDEKKKRCSAILNQVYLTSSIQLEASTTHITINYFAFFSNQPDTHTADSFLAPKHKNSGHNLPLLQGYPLTSTSGQKEQLWQRVMWPLGLLVIRSDLKLS